MVDQDALLNEAAILRHKSCSDATISSNKKHYESTIYNIKDYYGLVTDLGEFSQYLPEHQTSTVSKYRRPEYSELYGNNHSSLILIRHY